MRKIEYFIIVVAALVITSCNDWLDVKPSSQLDSKDLFSSESGYAEAMTGVYANLTKPELYGRELTFGALDVVGGNYYYPILIGTYNYMSAFGYKRNSANYSPACSNITDKIWNAMYTQVANLNSVLENIDDSKSIFSGDNYNIIKGEALGLRAFMLFDLVRLYGASYASGDTNSPAIPYVTKLSTSVTPIISTDSAMTSIIKDLIEAKELLDKDPIHQGTAPSTILTPEPSMSPATSGVYTNYGIIAYHNRRFTFNYYAAIATLSRAYLWKGDKVNALKYAKEIIDDQASRFPWIDNNNLKTVGTSSRNQDKTFATEHIFALNIKAMNDYMSGYCYFGTSSTVECNLAPFAFYQYGGGIFEGSTDYRQLYLSTSFNGVSYNNKFYQSSDIYQFFKERMPIIRVSEIYYIAAECETNLSQARTYLDAVRSNRGLANMALSSNITRSELDEEIRKEYQKEFIGEGQMWYYLKRHDIDLSTYDPGYRIYHAAYSYFSGKDLYIFDRPDDEQTNRY